MFNTAKDRQEKKRRRYLKAHDETYKLPTPEEKAAQADLDRSYNMTVEDLHSAIRMTCSKPGPSDNSRAAYRHEVKMTKERILNKGRTEGNCRRHEPRLNFYFSIWRYHVHTQCSPL